MRYLPVLTLLAQSALAQRMMPATDVETARRALTARVGEFALHCTVDQVMPVLLYTAPQMAAGFSFSMPLNQYRAGFPLYGWSVVVEITPEAGGEPLYLTGHVSIPILQTSAITGHGTYLLGRGTYAVKWALFDDAGMVCRQQWNIEVGNGEPSQDMDRTLSLVAMHKLKLETQDDTAVAPWRAVPPPPPATAPKKITLLVHADSDPRVRTQLLDAIVYLVQRLPAQTVRLVVFSLSQGRSLFRRDGFRLESLEEVERAMATLEFRAVNIRELQAQPLRTPAGMLTGMMQRELRDSPQSAAVVFVGAEETQDAPAARFTTKPQPPFPPFYYIHLLRGFYQKPNESNNWGTWLPTSAHSPDLIAQTMTVLKGKVIDVYFSRQFDQAAGQIQRKLHSQDRK